MKPFEKFLLSSVGLQRLTQIYLELRQYFQDAGWSEDDLKKPLYYTAELMTLYHNFTEEQKELYNQVKHYGFDVDNDEFNRFLEPILLKINEITPLKDGNY